VSRNIVRLAIVVWLGISVYSGFTEWTHHDVPVVRRVEVTEANLSGLETVGAAFECPAVIGGSGSPRMIDDVGEVVRVNEQPCESYVRGRQVLFWIDVVAGLAALGLTFAHIPRRFLDRRATAERTTGRPVTA
jgi:hypothetical protein